MVPPRLLAEHAEPGADEDGHRGIVGGHVGHVLAPALVDHGEVPGKRRGLDRGRGGVLEDREQLVLGHDRRPYRPTVAAECVVSATRGRLWALAVIDVAGFIADLKDHAVDHGFHVHDERHFVESYSLRQAWEVDLHPEEACGGPLDLHLSLEVDPRVLLAFEDKVLEIPEGDDPPDDYHFPLLFNWALPPLPHPPDLLVLATDLAGVGGPDLPLEVSAIDSFAAVTDAPERSLAIVAKLQLRLAKVFVGQELLCETLDRCLAVSQFLLEAAPVWLDEV